jgi:hypothetical protein
MLYDLHMDDDNILWIFPSDIGKELEAALEEFAKSFLKTATETEPLHILMDSRDAGKPTARARKTFAKLGRDPRIGKCAVVGGIERYSRVMAGLINRAVGRNNIRFFQSEEKAIAWLKE